MHINLFQNEKNLLAIFNWIKPQIGTDVLEVVSESHLRTLEKFKYLLIFIE